MKLNKTSRDKLLKGIDNTYQAFMALDCAEHSKIFDNSTSLNTLVRSMIQQGDLEKRFTVKGTEYTLKLIPEAGSDSYKIEITPTNNAPFLTFKEIEDPKNADSVIALLAQQNMRIDLNKPHPLISIDNHDSSYPVQIGGDKLSLYRTHLVTLNKIRQRVSKGEDISNLLIALATGSGKTYVQGLWLICLHAAGLKGFFGVPGKLEHQFMDDLSRLLTKEFIQDKIGNLGDPDSQDGFLGQDKDLVVGDAFKALDQHYQQLDACNPDEVLLSFDEQHLLMNVERRRIRLISLCNRFLSCFLTATPNEETYKLSGRSPVASMSNKQKEEAKQGKIPLTVTMTAQSARDKNAKTKGFFKRLGRRFNIILSDSIQKQPTNAAIEVLNQLPFMQQEVQGKTQRPLDRKMLFLVDDPDSLINLIHKIDRPGSDAVYEQGNLYSRDAISEMFSIEDVDKALIEDDLVARGLRRDERVDLKGKFKNIMLRNMLDYIISDALNMSPIELNQYRDTNPEQFRIQALCVLGMQNKLKTQDRPLAGDKRYLPQDISKEHYKKQLVDKIGEASAEHISGLLSRIAGRFKLTLNRSLDDQRDSFLFNRPSDQDLSQRILTDSLNPRDDLVDEFLGYAYQHQVLCVMDDMHSDDLPIETNSQGQPKPFWGMKAETYTVYNQDGTKSSKAKKRALKPIEVLDPEQTETRYTPYYDEHLTEAQADNFFKLGFAAVYISNRKTEGFSDLNLHTVINVCNSGSQRLNGPDKLLQGLGRNRGLDETIEPLFIHALGNQQKSTFDLRHLSKENYFKQYFKGMRQFKKAYLLYLGDKLSEDIIAEYHNNLSDEDVFNTVKFRTRVMKLIREDLREINSLNNHEIKLSRRQLRTVLDQANKRLDQHLKHVQNMNQLPTGVAILGRVMSGILGSFLRRSQRGVKETLKQTVDVLNTAQDKLYYKILTQTDFKQLNAKRFASSELLSLLSHQGGVIKAILANRPLSYLQQEYIEEFNQYKEIALKPLLLKFVKEEHQQRISLVLDNHPDLLGFLSQNQQIMDQLSNTTDAKESLDLIMSLYKQLPLKPQLVAADFVNLLEQVQGYQRKVDAGSRAMLNEKNCEQIASALSDEFILALKNRLLPFLLPEDRAKLERGLTTATGKAFFQSVLTAYAQNEMDLDDSGALYTLLNKHLGEHAIQDPMHRLSSYKEDMNNLRLKVEDNAVDHMNAEKYSELKSHFKDKIIPGCLNLCPVVQRQSIQDKITEESLDAFLRDPANIQTIQDADKPKDELANFILSKLTDEEISIAQSPELIEQQVAQSMSDVLRKKQEVTVESVSTGLRAFGRGILSKFQGQSFRATVETTMLENIVQDEDFLKAFSTLIPLEQYQQLTEKIKQDPQCAQTTSVAIMQLPENERQDPRKLVQCMAQGTGLTLNYIEDLSKQGQQDLKDLMALKDRQPSALLNAAAIEAMVQPTRDRLLPFLANYIADNTQRAAFIAHCNDLPSNLFFDYMLHTEHLLEDLDSKSYAQIRPPLLAFFNGLNALGDGSLTMLQPSDLRDLQVTAETEKTELEKMIYTETMAQYLTTDDFLEMVYLAYNDEDLGRISEFLKLYENRIYLSKRIQQGVSLEDLDELLQEKLPGIKQLNYRMKDDLPLFVERLDSEDKKLSFFDRTKWEPVFKNQLLKKLAHPLIIEHFELVFGFFEEKELELLLNTLYAGKPELSASQLKTIFHLLQNENMEGLEFEFSKPEYQHFDGYPIEELGTILGDVLQEMILCHCHFNQHGQRGQVLDTRATEQTKGFVKPEAARPKMYDKLSPEVREQVTSVTQSNKEMNGTFLQGRARIFSYLRSVQMAFPDINALHRYNHALEVRNIGRIKEQILEPIRSRTGKPGLLVGLMNFFERVGNLLNAFGERLIALRTKIFKPSAPVREQLRVRAEQEGQDRVYKEHAIGLAGSINALKKLSSPLDVTEETVDNLTARIKIPKAAPPVDVDAQARASGRLTFLRFKQAARDVAVQEEAERLPRSSV